MRTILNNNIDSRVSGTHAAKKEKKNPALAGTLVNRVQDLTPVGDDGQTKIK